VNVAGAEDVEVVRAEDVAGAEVDMDVDDPEDPDDSLVVLELVSTALAGVTTPPPTF
jgi:hypothetical protein